MSRTENSLRNIKFALLFQAASILVTFFTRKVFVRTLTQEYLGLDGTFSNLLSMLSLVELGIGDAVTFSLYKPLAEGRRDQIRAIMALYRRAYWAISAAVTALGSALTPFLPVLVRDFPDSSEAERIYLLFVLNTALSYFCVYKQSLIIADQRQYLVTAWHDGLKILLALAQALFLWLTRNYFVYLGLQTGTTLLENWILSRQAGRLYPYIRTGPPPPLDRAVRGDILRNTKAMMAHKMGGVLVFGTDNLLISLFCGVTAVGLYSNYLLVTRGLSSIYSRLFRPLTASIGNLGATDGKARALPVFRRVCFAGGWLYGLSAVCLTVLLNPFIALWVGEAYLLSQGLVVIIALNFYVTGLREAVLLFRNAYGLYWHDRWKPLAESLINLTVSAALAARFGMAGILAGTFVSTMSTCFWIEPLVLFRHGLGSPAGPYFRDCALNALVTLLTAAAVWGLCTALPGEGVPLFLEKMAVCGTVGNLGYLLAYRRREELRYFVDFLRRRLRRFRDT